MSIIKKYYAISKKVKPNLPDLYYQNYKMRYLQKFKNHNLFKYIFKLVNINSHYFYNLNLYIIILKKLKNMKKLR